MLSSNVQPVRALCQFIMLTGGGEEVLFLM